MDAASMPLGVFGILRETFKIPARNGKLFLFIAIAIFIPRFLLLVAMGFAMEPFQKDMLAKLYMLSNMNDPGKPDYENLLMKVVKDAGFMILEAAVSFVLLSVISLFGRIATICVSAAAYSNEHLTTKELGVRMRFTWKRTAITWCYILLFNFAMLIVIFVLLYFVTITAMFSGPLAFAAAVLEISATVCYFYLNVVWELSVVVSVLEADNYGIEAVTKAFKVIKGRKRIGCILFALVTAISLVIDGVLIYAIKYVDQSQASQLGIKFASEIVSCFEVMFMAVAFTLFYFECKKNQGEKVEIEGESGYSPIPFDTTV